jgi:hypothetical protein
MITLDQLLNFDNDYFEGFDDYVDNPMTEEDAVRQLVTWFFYSGTLDGRERIKNSFPELYVQFLEQSVDHFNRGHEF